METCDGLAKNCCKICQEPFANKHVLYRHKKTCTSTNVINQVNSNNNNSNNQVNINVGTINLLKFPKDDEPHFDFIVDNITKSVMKQVCTLKPEIGFRRFMGAVLENPVNLCMRKSSPNVTYSKIHLGEGEWEFIGDDKVFPTATMHMTTAALGKLIEFQQSLKYICDDFKRHVQTINEDDEAEVYHEAIQSLKLMVVNMTRKLEEKQKALATAALNV